jgi:hypothetical protein
MGNDSFCQRVAEDFRAFLKDFFIGFEWWWLAMPFLAIGSVYLAYGNRSHELARLWVRKDVHEVAAIVLLGIAVGVFALRYLYLERRQVRLTLILLVWCVAFLCREIHFTGTHRGIWVAIALIVLWAIWWAPRLKDEIVRYPGRFLMLAAVFTYFCGQLVERRVFRASRLAILPHEQAYHVMIEETIENAGHLLFLAAAVRGILRPGGTSPPEANGCDKPADTASA